jgi:hypothetical protein
MGFDSLDGDNECILQQIVVNHAMENVHIAIICMTPHTPINIPLKEDLKTEPEHEAKRGYGPWWKVAFLTASLW